jgi:hypothetical protein
MSHAVWLFLLLALVPASAQQTPPPADPLAALRQTAEQTGADWETLASGLESKIATLLPCDPKSRAAVEEVSHASEARLSALSAYLKVAAANAKQDTEQAKKVLATQAALAGGWNTERVEADQEQTAIEAQLAILKESMRKRGALVGAEKVLAEIGEMVKARSSKSEELASHKDELDTLLGNLIVAYQNRQAALENESTLVDSEAALWTAYYKARVQRATTECSIINPGANTRRRKQ